MNHNQHQVVESVLERAHRAQAQMVPLPRRVRAFSPRPLVGSLVLGLLLQAAAPVLTSAAAEAYGAQQLEPLLASTNLLPRAFVKGHEIRIYCTNDAQRVMFKAAWEPSRVAAHEFSYATATLEACKPPKRMPDPASHWSEVIVLSKAESERCMRSAAGRLVPAETGRGIYCQHGRGEAVLYRNAAGQVQLVSLEEKPADVLIERRYNRHELASATASALEADLRVAYPNQTLFLLTIGSGSRIRLAFLDMSDRQAIVLYPPRGDDDAGHTAHLGLKLSNLASFILVDNVWTFLKNPVSSSGRTVNQFLQWPLTVLTPRLRAGSSAVPPLTNTPGMDLAAWEQWLDRHSHTPRERGSMRLLIDGDQFYRLLERRMMEATNDISLHVCIFDRDDIAVDMADRLKQRSTNVAVRVVFDRLLSRGAGTSPPATPMREGFVPPGSIAKYLRRDSEVRVRPQPNPGFTADHSKVMLVDGRYAYVGGMNLGREYRYEWHDLMAEVQGPVVASFQRQFEKKWAQLSIWGDCGLAEQSLCGKQPGCTTNAAPDCEMIELRRLYTKTFSRQIRKADLAAINRASSYVFAENPYFFSNDLLNALVRARLRGVDVRVVLPSENDAAVGHKSNLVTANYLIEHGVRVYFYPGMTHVKALLVDGWACFGSANFDAFSLRLNREANLATSDPAFAAKFRQELFEADFARSREVKEPLQVGWSDYLVDALLSPF
jgi:cardiolipin synthase A/B